MNAYLKTLLIVATMAAGSLATPETTKADQGPYWRGYWGWYDQQYVPYHRHYYSSPSYGYGNNYNYGYGNNYGYGYSRPSYGYGGYYSAPYQSYYAPGPGVGVQVGNGRTSVNLGWW